MSLASNKPLSGQEDVNETHSMKNEDTGHAVQQGQKVQVVDQGNHRFDTFEFEKDQPNSSHSYWTVVTRLFTHPNLRALTAMLLFTTAFTFAQGIGAAMANSVSMAADSGTMIIDTLTYVMNLVTEYRKLSGKKSAKLELYTSFVSVIGLFAVTIAVMIDAKYRLCCDPEEDPVNPKIMFGFTMVNLLLDVIELHLYAKATGCDSCEESQKPKKNLNMTSAFVHLLADTLRTLTVLASSIMVWGLGFNSVETDAIGSLVVSFFILIAGGYVGHELWASWRSERIEDNEYSLARTEDDEDVCEYEA